MTTQTGNVTAAVTSVSFPVANQQLTTPALPNHPATGAIQTVKIGGGQAQVISLSRFETPRFQMGTRVTIASGHNVVQSACAKE